jgi:hypothetical protein
MNEQRAAPVRELLVEAAGYWERRRIAFNVTLVAVVVAWVALTWPEFREALRLPMLATFVGLALLLNLGYSAIYFLDVPLQRSGFAATWRAARRVVWLAITAVAIVLTNTWIAEELYPAVRA